MQMIQALKKAASLGRKGDYVAIMPPTGGLPSKVVVKLPEARVAWLVEDVIESPGAVVEVGALRDGTSGKGTAFSTIARTINIPTCLVFHKGTTAHMTPCTPLLQLAEWFPPWPMGEGVEWQAASPYEADLLNAALYPAVGDELRPEMGCVTLTAGESYVSTEVQQALANVPWSVDAPVKIPVSGFHKWPPGDVQAYFDAQKAYFTIGDELRAIRRNVSDWSSPLLHTYRPSRLEASMSLKALRAPFKEAKKITDRRMIALGIQNGAFWIQVGEGLHTIPAMIASTSSTPSLTAQAVLDGNLFLDMLKSWPCPEISVGLDPANDRAPVSFHATDFSALLQPLIPVG